MRLTLLHTNDIHGRQERIAQIATLVRREKAEAETGRVVLYLDAGDVEETTNRLSNLTKGVAMHRLLGETMCDAAVVGNAAWVRYGPEILAEHVAAAPYPLLLANFEPSFGPFSSVLLDRVGIVGVTSPMEGIFTDVDWGFAAIDELDVARREARSLRERGAEVVVLLSHLGLSTPPERWDDLRIAAELDGEVDIIVGAHSHDLLPGGRWVGRVLVVQAGEFGEHVGRVEIDGESIVATVEPVGDDVVPWPGVAAEAARIEQEVALMLGEVLGTIDRPLDGAFIAEILRRRMQAVREAIAEYLTA